MIFLDSTAIIALGVQADEFHTSSVVWRTKKKNESFFLSNAIFIETMSWVRHHYGRQMAVAMGNYLFSSDDITIERVTSDDEREAWALFQKIDGRGVSMVDCTSVIVMKRLKIKEIFSFDQDFKKFGLTVVPKI